MRRASLDRSPGSRRRCAKSIVAQQNGRFSAVNAPVFCGGPSFRSVVYGLDDWPPAEVSRGSSRIDGNELLVPPKTDVAALVELSGAFISQPSAYCKFSRERGVTRGEEHSKRS